MKLFLKGCLIGIGKVLPGISGSILAIRLGVYEKVVESITQFRKQMKDNMTYLGILGSGFVLATVLGSKVLLEIFLHYEILLKALFFLFILTGLPSLIKKSNSYKIALITFLLGSLFFFLPSQETTHFSFFTYFVMGAIEALSTIIPGLSGTAIYLSLGWYEEVLRLFGDLLTFPIGKLVPFSIGLIAMASLLLRLIHYCLTNYSKETYSAITGFFLSSLFFIF